MTVSDLWSQAHVLLDECDALLQDTTGGNIARKVVLYPVPAMDCEMLAVILGPIAMYTPPSTPLARGQAYAGGWVNLVTYQVMVARDCTPQLKGRKAPTVAEYDASMREWSEDVWALWNGIPQRMAEGTLFGGRCTELYMDGAAPIPEQGTFVGWLISMRAAVQGYLPGS